MSVFSSALDSISQTISALYPYWASLQVLGKTHTWNYDVFISAFTLLDAYRSCFHVEGSVTRATANQESTKITCHAHAVTTTTGLVYDEKMMEHLNMWDRCVSFPGNENLDHKTRNSSVTLSSVLLQTSPWTASENFQNLCKTSAAGTGWPLPTDTSSLSNRGGAGHVSQVCECKKIHTAFTIKEQKQTFVVCST